MKDAVRKTDHLYAADLCITRTAVLRHTDFCVMLKIRLIE